MSNNIEHDALDREVGMNPETQVRASAEHERMVDDALGLQLISIRLPKKLIEDLKLIASKEGLGYQPMIRRVLLRFASAEFRSMAHEQLRSELSEVGNQRTECEPDLREARRA